MTDVVGRVESLGHRTYGEVRNDVFLDASFGLSQQLVHLLGHGASLVGLEYVAEAQNEGPEFFELLLVRNVVYAINHRAPHGTAVHFVMSAEFGDLFVGQQHELFDELVGLLLLLEIDAQGFAFGVEFELGLFALEAYGSALEACFCASAGPDG